MLRLKSIVCVLALGGAAAARDAEPPADGKPLRVLLAASAATREFQFLRTLLLRDRGANRAEIVLYLQPVPGRADVRAGAGADSGYRLLDRFPERAGALEKDKTEDKPYNLSTYDVIVAFDLDWGRLDADQAVALGRWVENGGGLVVVAGPVNTYQLSRKAAPDKLKPVIDLYPVAPGDSRLEELNHPTDKPFVLHFAAPAKATPKFLQLDPDGKGPLAGWDAFFFGAKEEHKEDEAERGFYGAYPVDTVKPGATVLATFADPRAKLSDGKEAPFLVTSAVGKGRVVYFGSGEMWRLRQYREAFHDRFWAGLVRYAAGASEKEEAAPERKEAPVEAPKRTADELSLEVNALRGLYAFDLALEQRKTLEKLAGETMGPARDRRKTKVSEEYLEALTDLHAALIDADDDDAIDAREDAFGEVEDKETPDLDDGVELTAAARQRATEVFRKLKSSQLAVYIRRQDEVLIDPRDQLVQALGAVRKLKRDQWKDQRDAIAEDAAAALAGVDAEKAGRISDQVVALLSKARGLTTEEFKAQKGDLEKAAGEIAEADPDAVLRNRAEYALAQLLSNPRLEAALKARSK